MKKTVIAFIMIAGFYFTGISQVIKPAIGINFTHLSNDPLSYETTGRIGWQIGGTIAFGDKFYLEPGIFWEKNNWNLQTVNQPEIPEFTNDISAIKIPLFAGINVIGNADDDNFHIMGGPTMRIVTNADPGSTGLTKDDFADFIWGMDIGAGISFHKFFIDAGYEWGLSNIYENEAEDIRSRGFWLNAGFRLKFL